MRRLAATAFAILASAAAWAQMPDRGSWMAGGDDGGSGLPGGGWDWQIAAVFLVFGALGYVLPKPYHHVAWGLFWTWPFLLWGGLWAWSTFLR